MTRLRFGLDVPCRYCDLRGTVKVRKVKATTADAAASPSKRVKCPVCMGRGYLPVEVADRAVGS